jgi:formylglycine-generating enzyme required for sulfatase activity
MTAEKNRPNKNDAVKAALIEYRAAWFAGEREEPAAFCRSHPECGPELRNRIDDFIYVAESLHDDAAKEEIPSSGDSRKSAGWTLGGYRIVREIGRGGMGVVYEAEELSLERRVALKILPPHLSFYDDAVLKFRREAQAGGRQSHPGIVSVYAVGEHEGIHFISQELVEGGATLADTLRQHKRCEELPRGYFREVAEFVAELADALEYAHNSGVVHRDVKPSNILLTAGGHPKLTDFGLAKIEDALALSRTGDLAGTPYYMSPEQASSRRTEVDRRTDIYSLGVTLYEMLTLRLPFEGDTSHEVLKKIVFNDPEESHKVNPRTPRDLSVIGMKAMEKDPGRRYQSMAAFAADLRRYLSGDVILAKPAALGRRLWKRVKRNPTVSAVAAVAALAAVVLLGYVLLWSYPRLRKAWDAESAARIDAEENLKKFNMLAAITKLKTAKNQQKDLFPPWPEQLPAMSRWIRERAEPLVARLPLLEKTLAEVRKKAFDYTEEQRRKDRESHPDAHELVRREASVEEAKQRLSALDDRREDTSEKSEFLDRLIEYHRGFVEELSAKVETRRRYEFTDTSDKFLNDTLASLIGEITAFRDNELDNVRKSRDWAKSIQERSIESRRERWDRAIAAVGAGDGGAANALYRGLKLEPQIGLVPIGADPDSKLREFVHLRSGTEGKAIPDRDPETGRLLITDDTGIVFVLIPGGTFFMGAQAIDRAAANFDPLADKTENPVEEIALDPFFISKYEMTQGQWKRLSGGDMPSHYRVGKKTADGKRTLKHPVEQVNWTMCDDLFRRFGLILPTEAQWEYSCRGGTDTPWWTGSDRESLRGAVNIADETAGKTGVTWPVDDWPGFSDGYITTAPVDSLRPNPFGLHNVHGNVWEWCRDLYGGYGRLGARPGDGFREWKSLLYASYIRVHRGGSFTVAAVMTRSSNRQCDPPDFQRGNLGVRPARSIIRK